MTLNSMQLKTNITLKKISTILLNCALTVLCIVTLLKLKNTVFVSQEEFNNMQIAAMKDNKYITLRTKYGNTVIELYPDKAPGHVQRIQELVAEGFYNGLKFHRVIDGFMVQTGCPKGDGTGGSSKGYIHAEFNDIHHARGIVAMARSSLPHSANSQFFIVLQPSPHLDGQYTAFGRVMYGMEAIDKIKKGDVRNNGIVFNPDIIEEIYIGMPDDVDPAMFDYSY